MFSQASPGAILFAKAYKRQLLFGVGRQNEIYVPVYNSTVNRNNTCQNHKVIVIIHDSGQTWSS